MGTPALQQSAVATSLTIQSNTSRYHRPGSCAFWTQEALEHLARVPWATAGVWSDLWIRVVTNTRDGSSVTVTRINGADGNQSVTVPALTTGFFHDAVNTDVLSPGDLIDYQTFSTNSVGVSPGYNLTILQTVFTATAAGRVYRRVASQTLNRDTGFQSLGPGVSTNVAELGFQQVCTPGTFRNAAVDVFSNIGGSSSILTFRLNGADTALTLTLPVGTTGILENLVDAVAVVQDDLVNWHTADNTTVVLQCRSYCVDYDTAAFHGGGTRDGAGIDLVGSTCPGPDSRCDGFAPHSGWFINVSVATPESNQQAEALVTDNWTGLVVVVPINGQNGTTTWKGRKDGADTGFVVSVPALTTGTFKSVGAPVAVVPTSLINIRRTAGGNSASALTYYTHNFLGVGQPGCPGDTGSPRDDGALYTPTDPAACPGPGDTGAARDDGIPYTP